MAALTASTGVGEGRRSDRANALSCIMRDFNHGASYDVSKSRGKKIKRVEGKDRVSMFASHCSAFNKKVERARSVIGEERYGQLVKYFDGDANRISRVDLEKRKDKYAKGVDKPRKVTKSEQSNCGIDVPAEMDGGLKVKDIQRKYDEEIKAEIDCRGIEYPKDDAGNTKAYDQLSMKEIRDLLRVDQLKSLAGDGKAGDGIRPSDIKYIVPRSAAMRALVVRINSG